MTSDERRVVATRLRDIESIYGEQRYPIPEIDFVLAIAKITDMPLGSTLNDLAFRLAGLVDPTCKREDKDTYRGLYYCGDSLCSKCGELLIPKFRYCPYCGSRIVKDCETCND